MGSSRAAHARLCCARRAAGLTAGRVPPLRRAGMCSLDDRGELWLLTERMDYSLYHALQRRGLRWWNGRAARPPAVAAA